MAWGRALARGVLFPSCGFVVHLSAGRCMVVSVTCAHSGVLGCCVLKLSPSHFDFIFRDELRVADQSRGGDKKELRGTPHAFPGLREKFYTLRLVTIELITKVIIKLIEVRLLGTPAMPIKYRILLYIVPSHV